MVKAHIYNATSGCYTHLAQAMTATTACESVIASCPLSFCVHVSVIRHFAHL